MSQDSKANTDRPLLLWLHHAGCAEALQEQLEDEEKDDVIALQASKATRHTQSIHHEQDRICLDGGMITLGIYNATSFEDFVGSGLSSCPGLLAIKTTEQRCGMSVPAQVDAMEAFEYDAEIGQELISAPGE